MKVKYILIPGILGILGSGVGAMFKIQHWPGGTVILTISLALELIAGLLIIWKLLTYRGGSDFLNS